MNLKNLIFNKISLFIIFTIYLLSNCYLGSSSGVKTVYEFIAIILTVFVIFLFILYICKRKKDAFLYYFFFYLIFLLLACYIGKYSSIVTFFHFYYPIVGFCLYFMMAYDYNERDTIKSLNFSFNILTFLNFCTIIFYPNGMYSDGLYNNCWFFKYDNLHIMMFIPNFLINLLVLEKYKNSINTISIYFNWIIIILSILICKSATAIVSLLIICGFHLFKLCKNRKENNCLIKNTNTLMNVYIILFFLIIIFRMQDIFSWLIVKFLGKDLTFSNRTVIWDRTIELIRKKPILGYGIENTEIFKLKMGNQAFTHAHNTFLNVIYSGGFVTFSFFFLMLKRISKLMNEITNKYSDYFKITFFSLLVMCLVEARDEKMGFYIILFILYCISNKKNSIKNKENKVIK